MLALLEGLTAGIWLGGYLFTTFVVSPALKQLPMSDAGRTRTRSVIGRRYGKLAMPLLALWFFVLLGQDFGAGIAVRVTLLLVLITLSGLHAYVLGARMQHLADQEVTEGTTGVARLRAELQRRSSWLTYGGLGVSIALALLALNSS